MILVPIFLLLGSQSNVLDYSVAPFFLFIYSRSETRLDLSEDK